MQERDLSVLWDGVILFLLLPIQMEEAFEEEEEEDHENVYFSTDDLLRIRKAIFLLLQNFLRFLPKFSLEEKPQCFQNCLQVMRFLEQNVVSPSTNRQCRTLDGHRTWAVLPFMSCPPKCCCLWSSGRLSALWLSLMLSICWLLQAGQLVFHYKVSILPVAGGEMQSIEPAGFGACLCSALTEGRWFQS